MNNTDLTILKRGFKRVVIALLTVALSAVALCGFVMVATQTGYRAVVAFGLSMVAARGAFILFYALGHNLKARVRKKATRK